MTRRPTPHLALTAAMLLTGLFAASTAAAQPANDSMNAYYVGAYKVSPAEAQRRLRLSDEPTTLVQNQLRERFPDTFAGLYIEHKPAFRIVAKFTQAPEASLRQVTQDPNFVSELAPYSLNRLRATQKTLGDALRLQGIDHMSDIDLHDSTITVYVKDTALVRSRLSKLSQTGPTVRLVSVPGFIENTVSLPGGKKLLSIAAQEMCTSGFNVKNAAGTLGITTAGHCPNGDIRLGSTTGYLLPFQAERYQGETDLQWHTFPNSIYTPTPTVTVGGSNSNDVTSVVTLAGMAVGRIVCKYGQASFETCGSTLSLDTSFNVDNVAGVYVVVRRPDGQPMTVKGDSGGPVYVRTGLWKVAAYGLVSGRGKEGSVYENDMLFMPTDRFANLGLTILTLPTP